jgi:hypothetical protein
VCFSKAPAMGEEAIGILKVKEIVPILSVLDLNMRQIELNFLRILKLTII